MNQNLDNINNELLVNQDLYAERLRNKKEDPTITFLKKLIAVFNLLVLLETCFLNKKSQVDKFYFLQLTTCEFFIIIIWKSIRKKRVVMMYWNFYLVGIFMLISSIHFFIDELNKGLLSNLIQPLYICHWIMVNGFIIGILFVIVYYKLQHHRL